MSISKQDKFFIVKVTKMIESLNPEQREILLMTQLVNQEFLFGKLEKNEDQLEMDYYLQKKLSICKRLYPFLINRYKNLYLTREASSLMSPSKNLSKSVENLDPIRQENKFDRDQFFHQRKMVFQKKIDLIQAKTDKKQERAQKVLQDQKEEAEWKIMKRNEKFQIIRSKAQEQKEQFLAKMNELRSQLDQEPIRQKDLKKVKSVSHISFASQYEDPQEIESRISQNQSKLDLACMRRQSNIDTVKSKISLNDRIRQDRSRQILTAMSTEQIPRGLSLIASQTNLNKQIKDQIYIKKQYDTMNSYVKRQEKAALNKSEAREYKEYSIESQRQKYEDKVNQVKLRKQELQVSKQRELMKKNSVERSPPNQVYKSKVWMKLNKLSTKENLSRLQMMQKEYKSQMISNLIQKSNRKK